MILKWAINKFNMQISDQLRLFSRMEDINNLENFAAENSIKMCGKLSHFSFFLKVETIFLNLWIVQVNIMNSWWNRNRWRWQSSDLMIPFTQKDMQNHLILYNSLNATIFLLRNFLYFHKFLSYFTSIILVQNFSSLFMKSCDIFI